jgi:hypothetical protein
LWFGQTTGQLNPANHADSEGPVRLPKELLESFPLEGEEAAFAIRSFRLAEREYSGGWRPGQLLDASYLPLLKVVAVEDNTLRRLMVKGRAVAHFEVRQEAARAIAAITKGRATYVGLAGEAIDSGTSPEPCKDQDALLAKFVVDRIEAAKLPVQGEGVEWTPEEMRVAELLDLMVRTAVEAGTEYSNNSPTPEQDRLMEAIRGEARGRKVSLKGIVP